MNDIQKSFLVSQQKLNEGPWNQEESLKYLIFLDQNKIVMSSRHKKKRFRVFDQMSDFVQTRSSLQCRSHHQKAIQKYKKVKEIILHQKQQIDSKNYRLRVKELRQIAKINENYKKVEKPNVVQQNVQSNQEIMKVQENSILIPGIQFLNEYFSPHAAYTYQMTPLGINPLSINYFYCQFLSQN